MMPEPTPDDRFLRTDSGNAELIATKFPDRLRFDHRRGRWLLWMDNRWVEDREGAVFRLAKAAARERLSNAARITDDGARKQSAAWALQSESRYRLQAALDLAKSTSPISDSGENWDTDQFLLGVRNGIVDLRNGQLRLGRPRDRVAIYTEVSFDAAAQCPCFERFLDEIFLHDCEVTAFIQRAIGYCLSGAVTEQCLFLCHGDGENGKSTFLETIRNVLGDYAHNLPFSAFELVGRSAISNDMASLVSKRFVTAAETSEGARLNEARVKALTGGDRCTARFLYREYFSFDPTAKFWLAFNHKPHVTDDSHGFWRRVRLIPFLAHFSGNDCDKDILAKLKTEASGILAWAIRGCLLWQQQGLGLPPSIDAATKAYREESDPVAEFLDDRYVISTDAFVESSILRSDYEDWAKQNGEKPLHHRGFSNRLRARGFVNDRSGHNRARGWRGLLPKAANLVETGECADARTDADAKIQ
jgi:putative DNA primase/helicase